jgi:hypothetical protein
MAVNQIIALDHPVMSDLRIGPCSAQSAQNGYVRASTVDGSHPK